MARRSRPGGPARAALPGADPARFLQVPLIPAERQGVTTSRTRLSWSLLGLGALACVGFTLLPPAGLPGGVGYLTVAAIGVAMSCLGAAVMHGPRRRIWVIVAVGQLLYFVGDVLWVVYEDVLHIAPYPSVADAAYLSRYPLVAIGLLWLIRGRRRGRDRAALLDAAIISTGFAILGAEFVVVPAAASGGESLLSQVVAGAYPVADLLLFAVLVRLCTSGAARSLSFWTLACGTGVMLFADVEYVLRVVGGAELTVWLDVCWLTGYLLIGFTALHPSVETLSEPTPDKAQRVTLPRLAVLGAALAMAPLTEMLRDITGHDGISVIVALGAALGIGLVIARIWDLLRALQTQAVQLAALARNDGLTGVANRRSWDHELSRACAGAREQGTPLAVAIMDLDHFKTFNDTHGHLRGDLVLKETAAAWRELLDGRGLLARFGGEEFTVLLPGTSADAAQGVLDRLRTAVSHEQTCSIGLAVWDGQEDPEALIARADLALYHAKRSGRNRVAVHDGTATRDAVYRGGDPTEATLRTVYQPIVDLTTGSPIAYEALTRFDGRNPREVFDTAARLGTAKALEAAAIRSALATWHQAEPLSVNVSFGALVDPAVQRELPDDLSRLILEVTETDFVDYSPEVALLLGNLRARGARLAVDDMGVGFSNLERVVSLNPEMIKLDMSLVRDIDRKPMNQAVIRASVAYARDVGAQLCAEGIETAAEHRTLVEAGVTVGQGYLFGRPAPASTLPYSASRDLLTIEDA